jgi:hypothetical protein
VGSPHVRSETTWAHIQAAQALVQKYALPLRFYVVSLRVFRFVQGRDSVWRKHVLETDDVETQWRRIAVHCLCFTTTVCDKKVCLYDYSRSGQVTDLAVHSDFNSFGS